MTLPLPTAAKALLILGALATLAGFVLPWGQGVFGGVEGFSSIRESWLRGGTADFNREVQRSYYAWGYLISLVVAVASIIMTGWARRWLFWAPVVLAPLAAIWHLIALATMSGLAIVAWFPPVGLAMIAGGAAFALVATAPNRTPQTP